MFSNLLHFSFYKYCPYICFCRELNVSSSDAIDSDGLAHLVPKGEDARCSNLLLVDLTGCWNVR
jgi:hypothetical protein